MSDLSEFLAVVIPAVIIAFVFFSLFFYFRTRVPQVYEPRLTWCPSDQWSSLPAMAWGWLYEVISIPEEKFIQYAGLDAAIYVRVMSLGIKLFIPLMVFGLAVLVPINASGENSLGGFDSISISNVGQESDLMWAHAVAGWLFSGLTYFLLNRQYKEILTLVLKFDESARLHQYVVLVRSVAKESRNDEALSSFFRELFPQSFVRADMVRDYQSLEDKYTEWKENKVALMKAMYVVSQGEERPTHRICRDTAPCNSCAGIGCCCPPWTEVVDSVDHYTHRMHQLTNEMVEERSKERAIGPCAFVAFKSLADASKAAQVRLTQGSRNWIVNRAPEPRDVYWPNLMLEEDRKVMLRSLVDVFVVMLVIFWTIPVSFVASLTSLSALSERLPFLESVADSNAALKGFLQGFLPTLGIIILMALLPPVLRALSTLSGLHSTSSIDYSLMGKYFFFEVFHVFLVTTLSSSLYSAISEIISTPSSIFSLLGQSLPGSAKFFINFVLLKALGDFPGELGRVAPLVVGYLKARIAASPEDKKEAYNPGRLDYGVSYPNQILIFVIVMSYSVIAPLILPFGVLYFLLGYITWKNQFSFVYIPIYETGGRMWPKVFGFLMSGLAISQITLIGVLGLKYGYAQVAVLIPLLVITYMFYNHHQNNYGVVIENGYVPLDQAIKADKNVTPDAASFDHFFEPLSLNVRLDSPLDKHGDEEKMQDVNLGSPREENPVVFSSDPMENSQAQKSVDPHDSNGLALASQLPSRSSSTDPLNHDR